MTVQSAANDFQRRFPVPPAGGFTPTAELDRELSQGITDSVETGAERMQADRARCRSNFFWESVHHGVFGTALGLALSNISPLGAAIGLGTGVYVAWNKTARKDSGKVAIEVDGHKRSTPYYMSTSSYQKEAPEIRAELTVEGRLGDRIAPFQPGPGDLTGPVDRSRLNALAPHQDSLKELGSQRRLVASFGQKSGYGYQVLNLVEANLARDLIAAGKPVYAVAGTNTTDTTHTYKVAAANNRSTVRGAQDRTYLERTFDYQTIPLEGPESLNNLPEGTGLPQGFNGVYERLESCTTTIGIDDQKGFGAILGKHERRSSFEYRTVSRAPNLELKAHDRARVRHTSTINVRDLIMMASAAAGMATGLGLFPGIPWAPLGLGVVAGVAGREVGLLVNDRLPSWETRAY